MGVTNGLALPFPELTESADGPNAIGALANATEDYVFDRILPSGVTRAPSHHWGSVTTLPSGALVKRGDTAWYSTYNVLVTYDGTNWRAAEIPAITAGDATAGFYAGQYRDHSTEGLQRWTGSRWGRVQDYTIGEANYGTVGTAVAGTPTWTDLCTVTGTSWGGPCSARWDGSLLNGASGADRTASWQVVCDGTAISSGNSYSAFSVPLSGSPHIPKAGIAVSTPAAGSHTWKLQANASAASAVVTSYAKLVIIERP